MANKSINPTEAEQYQEMLDARYDEYWNGEE
jgi:hypothetical protein